MSVFAFVPLDEIPFPDVVAPADFEAAFAAAKQEFARLFPDHDLRETDPAILLLRVLAATEVRLRQRINEAAAATFRTTARGADLDNIAAIVPLQRLLLDPGDPDAVPPRPPVHESDDDFRRRLTLAHHAFSVAGPDYAYVFHALSAGATAPRYTVDSPAPGRITVTVEHPPQGAGALIRDASATSPQPGDAVVTLLGRGGRGTVTAETIATVRAHLDAVKPMTDRLTVQAATIRDYRIAADLTVYPGPDPAAVRGVALERVQAYASDHHRLGHDITRAGLIAALTAPGVQNCTLHHPAADLVIDATEAAYATDITVQVTGKAV